MRSRPPVESPDLRPDGALIEPSPALKLENPDINVSRYRKQGEPFVSFTPCSFVRCVLLDSYRDCHLSSRPDAPHCDGPVAGGRRVYLLVNTETLIRKEQVFSKAVIQAERRAILCFVRRFTLSVLFAEVVMIHGDVKVQLLRRLVVFKAKIEPGENACDSRGFHK